MYYGYYCQYFNSTATYGILLFNIIQSKNRMIMVKIKPHMPIRIIWINRVCSCILEEINEGVVTHLNNSSIWNKTQNALIWGPSWHTLNILYMVFNHIEHTWYAVIHFNTLWKNRCAGLVEILHTLKSTIN